MKIKSCRTRGNPISTSTQLRSEEEYSTNSDESFDCPSNGLKTTGNDGVHEDSASFADDDIKNWKRDSSYRNAY